MGELDSGDLINDELYLALDKLYERGWIDRNKERDYDPRGTDEWQAVLDMFRLPRTQIEAVKQMRLQDGDVVVVKSPKRLTFDTMEHIRQTIEKLKDHIKADFKVVVLEEGMDIEIIGKKD